MLRGETETAIFCARTNTLVYVVYLNSRKKQYVTAHLKVAYGLNAVDANATYKLYFGGSGASATMRPQTFTSMKGGRQRLSSERGVICVPSVANPGWSRLRELPINPGALPNIACLPNGASVFLGIFPGRKRT